MFISFAHKLIAALSHIEFITLYILLAFFASPWIALGTFAAFALTGFTIAALENNGFI